MTDSYPDTVEFEIDRVAARRYLRTKWFASWTGGFAVFSLLLVLMVANAVYDARHSGGVQRPLLPVVTTLAVVIVAASLLSTLLYFLLDHRRAAVEAAQARVIVEGNFLRIVKGAPKRMDWKQRFRSVVEYTTVDGWLMRRFGIMELRVMTTAGVLQIVGVKRCPEVRDTLVELDRLREKG